MNEQVMKALEDGFTWSSCSMSRYKHRHIIRALKIKVSDSQALVWCIQVRGHKRVIYESCIGMVSHGDPYSMRGHIHRHTIRAQKFKVTGSPACRYDILRWRDMKQWFMKTLENGFTWWSLLHEGAQTQTHNQSPKNHGKWLPSMYMIYWGEWTWNSGLWKPRGWFHMVIPTPWGGTYTDTQSGS